jgi:hypothetical protein
MKEPEIIYVTESLLQSVISDVVTIGLFMGMVSLNTLYLGGSWVVDLSALVALLIYAVKHGSSRVKSMNPEQAHEYLGELLKTRTGAKYDEEILNPQ